MVEKVNIFGLGCSAPKLKCSLLAGGYSNGSGALISRDTSKATIVAISAISTQNAIEGTYNPTY